MPNHPLGKFQVCPTCCVGSGCVYESDDFSGTLAKWTQTAGSWSIVSGAVDTSSADAILTCNTTHPTASNKYIAVVTVKFDTDGDVARVSIAGGDYYAEVERITSTCCRFRLFDNTGVDPVCLGSSGGSLSPWGRIVVCSEEDKIHASVGGSFPLTIPATVTSSVVALETGACTGTVTFEDFALSKHYDDDNTCPACGSEGCTWFADSGCASGSLSATDWTASGTWVYDSGLKCTADGAITVVPEQPLGAVTQGVSLTVQRPGTGISIKLYYDVATDAYIEIVGERADMAWIKCWSSGVQYGRQMAATTSTVLVRFCWDGSVLAARIGVMLYGVPHSTSVTLPGAPTANQPSIVVSGLSGGTSATIASCVAVKDATDIGASTECLDCGTPECASCQTGTFPTRVQIVLGNLTSHSYGCVCSDVTLSLVCMIAGGPGCDWSGYSAGPCSSGFTVIAWVTAVSGGYKLAITVTTILGMIVIFENTVLSGSPVDCMTAFDGTVPLVSAGGMGPCTLESATCTFTSPAP